MPNMLQFVKNGHFQIFWNLESRNSRRMRIQIIWEKNQTQWSNQVEKIPNMLQFVKNGHFQIFWNLEIPGKWWFKNSEWKTKLSDQYWVGKIPNMLQFVKNGNFQRISRFSGTWNLGIWKFWKSQKMQNKILRLTFE